jgi:[protein-PII] uridylyltransferase
MTAAERAARGRDADALCAAAYADAGCPDTGVALVAVGGYGRRELAPFSDLDLLLVHDDGVEPGEWAGALWYPLWDSGRPVDHAVRSVTGVLDQLDADLRVALGLLDLRHLAGDPNLTLRLRTAVLAGWRRDARRRLPELRRSVVDRHTLVGEVAHAAVPDLKEGAGGLRDATVLHALVASWLVDVPHADLERSRRALLDVRDALHEVAGRATDRVAPEYWPEIAERLGLPDAVAAQRHTRALARRTTHISRLAWRRVDAVLRRPSASGPRRPQLDRVVPGIAVSHEEVVLDRGVRPDGDPLLLLRAAAEAAERGLVLAPATAARLVRDGAPLPEPWPGAARDLLVRLLAAGPGLLSVWETLDETGALGVLLPEWEPLRLLPHASVVHRFTVDRHLVETCIEASRLIRRVNRPDLLVVAALLHDIGKGGTVDHAVAGAPVARDVTRRLGFDDADAEVVATLVRWHLLLPETATTRDPEDPATVAAVTDRVADREVLALLAALTEADALATSDKAWTPWRAGLVRDLVRRAGAVLADVPPAEPTPASTVVPALAEAGDVVVAVEPEGVDGALVRVVAADRTGLLADAAAMLALERATVRSARAWTLERDGGPVGVSEWSVAGAAPDAAALRQRLEAIAAGRVDPDQRLRRPAPTRLEPTVVVRPEASARATVLEVRAADRPGLVFTVCRAVADLGIAVRSAHVTTLGPQAVDVFYLQEEAAGPLADDRAAAAAHAIRAALVTAQAASTEPARLPGSLG